MQDYVYVIHMPAVLFLIGHTAWQKHEITSAVRHDARVTASKTLQLHCCLFDGPCHAFLSLSSWTNLPSIRIGY